MVSSGRPHAVAPLLGLVVVLSLAGCGSRSAAAPPPAQHPATYPATGAPYVPSPPACGSAMPAGVRSAPLLAAGQVVVAAVTCREGPGDPSGVVVRRPAGAVLARLVAALRLPSAPPQEVCPAIGILLPALAVQLQGGDWVSPQLPSGGCLPASAVIQALTAAAA